MKKLLVGIVALFILGCGVKVTQQDFMQRARMYDMKYKGQENYYECVLDFEMCMHTKCVGMEPEDVWECADKCLDEAVECLEDES